MLRCYVKAANALKDNLRADRDGLVSFEYVIVAALIVTVVAVAFNAAGVASIKNALTAALNALATAVTTAVGS